MKIIYNRIIPFPGFKAINLFGVVFARKEAYQLTPMDIRHQMIHTEQIRDLLYFGFYVCYVIEWVVRLFMKGNAYKNISFEREAYENQDNIDYFDTRRWCGQWRGKKDRRKEGIKS